MDEVFELFEPFRNVMAWDKSNNKVKAHKIMWFIFLLSDLTEENPLRDIPVEKKETEAKFRAYGDKDKVFTTAELLVLVPAIECFTKYNTTAEERILKAFDDKSDELRAALEETLPETATNEKDGVTAFVSNSTILTKGLKELETIKKVKMNVVAAVKREAMSQKIRGKIALSPLSRGNIELAVIDKEI